MVGTRRKGLVGEPGDALWSLIQSGSGRIRDCFEIIAEDWGREKHLLPHLEKREILWNDGAKSRDYRSSIWTCTLEQRNLEIGN